MFAARNKRNLPTKYHLQESLQCIVRGRNKLVEYFSEILAEGWIILKIKISLRADSLLVAAMAEAADLPLLIHAAE